MRIEQKIINDLVPVRAMLEQGRVIIADRALHTIIEELSAKLQVSQSKG